MEKAGEQVKKESQKQGFVQGAMILMIGTVTVKVVSMLFKIPVSNMLGGTGYSYFTNAYEIFNLLSTIAADSILMLSAALLVIVLSMIN